MDAALHLLSWVRNQWHTQPPCVLFDSGFCAAHLLKRIASYGWTCIGRIPKTWLLEGVALWRLKRQALLE